MDSFVVLSPVGLPPDAGRHHLRHIDDLRGKRVGFVWGMHGNSMQFWPAFEDEVLEQYKPAGVSRIHKLDTDGRFMGNTWIPAPLDVMREVTEQSDYALCGVGA